MNTLGVEGLFSLLLCLLLVTTFFGIMTKRMRDIRSSDLSVHRFLAYLCFCVYLLALVATERLVRTHGGEKWSPYFPFHVFFACVSLVSFLCALRYNGIRRREWHWKFVYTCISSFIVAFALAVPLLKLF